MNLVDDHGYHHGTWEYVDNENMKHVDNHRWIFSKYCKSEVHRYLNHVFNHEDLTEIRDYFECRPAQFVRSFRHLHNHAVRGIIKAYLEYDLQLIPETEARKTLTDMLEYEHKYMLDQSDTWDEKFIELFVRDTDIQDKLHQSLCAMKKNVADIARARVIMPGAISTNTMERSHA